MIDVACQTSKKFSLLRSFCPQGRGHNLSISRPTWLLPKIGLSLRTHGKQKFSGAVMISIRAACRRRLGPKFASGFDARLALIAEIILTSAAEGDFAESLAW
jgi:hypothetical protein